MIVTLYTINKNTYLIESKYVKVIISTNLIGNSIIHVVPEIVQTAKCRGVAEIWYGINKFKLETLS